MLYAVKMTVEVEAVTPEVAEDMVMEIFQNSDADAFVMIEEVKKI